MDSLKRALRVWRLAAAELLMDAALSVMPNGKEKTFFALKLLEYTERFSPNLNVNGQ